MTIEPTSKTIRGIAAALARARLFDDKIGNADEGRILAWAQAVEPHRISQQDLEDGVTSYYDSNRDGRTIQVADLVAHARAIRRERGEREPDEAREARQEALAAKVAEMSEELAGRRGIPAPEPKYKRPTANVLQVPCPWCHASVGQQCVVPRTKDRPSDGAHPSRRELAEQQGSVSEHIS